MPWRWFTCIFTHGYWGNEFHKAEKETASSEKQVPVQDALELELPIITLQPQSVSNT